MTFSFSHTFLYLSLFSACYLEESQKNGKWYVPGFPVCSSSFTVFTSHAWSSPSKPLLHHLKWKKLFLLHKDSDSVLVMTLSALILIEMSWMWGTSLIIVHTVCKTQTCIILTESPQFSLFDRGFWGAASCHRGYTNQLDLHTYTFVCL